jgi:hypothetical protein
MLNFFNAVAVGAALGGVEGALIGAAVALCLSALERRFVPTPC